MGNTIGNSIGNIQAICVQAICVLVFWGLAFCVCLLMAIDPPISLSRARRMRNAATKQRLWDAALKPSVDEKAGSQFATGSDRLYLIEAMLSQLHWQFIGQWQTQWCCDDVGEAHLASPLLSNYGTRNFVPEACDECNSVTASSKLWQPSQVELFEDGSPLHQELQNEAAARIQTFVRNRHLCGNAADSNPSSAQDQLQPCSRCGLDVVMDGTNAIGEYECDMCDTCDAVLHTNCLQVLHTLRGEWSVCPTCLVRFQHSIKCDLRSMPAASWNRIYDLFSDGRQRDVCLTATGPNCLQTLRVCAGESGGNSGADRDEIETQTATRSMPGEALESNARRLDTTLDYILRFLEGDHAKSGSLTEQIKDDVMHRIKATLAWKRQGRTGHEIEEKVAELNSMMMEIVSKL